MKKLKLNLDQIQVLSFTVETAEGGTGTVKAFEPNTDVGCGHGTRDFDSCTCQYCPIMPISYYNDC